jgi:hypothetical protein
MELLVLSNVPNIAVKVVSTDNPPTGGGAGASALSILSLEGLLLAQLGHRAEPGLGPLSPQNRTSTNRDPRPARGAFRRSWPVILVD